LAAFGAAFLAGTAALADEGMWTFDNFPAETVNRKYSTRIDGAWLDRVREATPRLSTGCSSSVVTKDGLVFTNHHCVRDCVQALSTASNDYIADGFITRNRSEEKLCPGMQADILTKISDVTARITAAIEGKTGQDFIKARDGAIAAIEKESCAGREAQFRCQVVTLYQGGQYKLYEFRKYSDVRLVFAPEEAMAFFGGDPDNFNFPRYDLDFAFIRLYENGQPASTPRHLNWRLTPPQDGEPVFMVGNPGSTQRLYTVDQLETLRDLTLPVTLLQYSEARGRMITFASENAENARTVRDDLFGIENSFKAFNGQHRALIDPALIAGKREAERELRAKVAADAGLRTSVGDPWGEIATAERHRRALYVPTVMMESRAGFRSKLFTYARHLVRAAQERAKPDRERLREYTDSQLPLLEKRLLDEEPVYPNVERLHLEFWLSKLREYLTADAEGTRTFLGKESPETIAARLSRSRLADAAYRKQLWEGGLAAIKASDDPMIRYVLKTDPASRAIRDEYENKVNAPLGRAHERIAKARFAVFGTGVYPDATFSLRVTYGKIAGWAHNGQTVPPFTYYKGLWERATGEDPYKLPPRWVDARGKVNANTVFNFSSTNDIIGGNSGSPVIDAEGNVIGVVFDGNIHSLGGAYGFDERVNRAVSVSAVSITEALRKIYGADTLVSELSGR
jgi:hypothetical protein